MTALIAYQSRYRVFSSGTSVQNHHFQIISMQVTWLTFLRFLVSVLHVCQKRRIHCIINQKVKRSYMGSSTILSLNCLMRTSFPLCLFCFQLFVFIFNISFTHAVTIGFALPNTNRGIKRKENSSDFGVRTTRGKRNSATRLASGKGTRHYSKVLGSPTTGNRTGPKLGLQRFNLQLVNVNHTVK